MNNNNKLSTIQAFGLIEVLIATVILAFGLLGIALVQQKALLLAKDLENQTTAEILMADMLNRLQYNPIEATSATSYYLQSYTSVNSNYLYLSSAEFRLLSITDYFVTTESEDLDAHTTALNTFFNSSSCYYDHTNCTPTSFAILDLLDWKTLLKTSLPNGVGIICFNSLTNLTNNDLTCDNTNPGTSTNPIYTIKIRWTDSKNNSRYLTRQTMISSAFPL